MRPRHGTAVVRAADEHRGEHIHRARPASSGKRQHAVAPAPRRPMLRTQPQTVSGAVLPAAGSRRPGAGSPARFLRGRVVQADGQNRPRRRKGQPRSICSQGVSRSDREITQKSCISGAPSTAAPDSAAVTPGTTSTSTPAYSPASCSRGPGHAVHARVAAAHHGHRLAPPRPSSSAQRQRSSSLRHGGDIPSPCPGTGAAPDPDTPV